MFHSWNKKVSCPFLQKRWLVAEDWPQICIFAVTVSKYCGNGRFLAAAIAALVCLVR